MILIKNIDVYTSRQVLTQHDILIKDAKIHKIAPVIELLELNDVTVIEGKGKKLIPGFIDTHIHGSYDYDFMDANDEKLQLCRNQLVQNGVTSILATTITSDQDELICALKQLSNAKQIKKGTNIVGVHFEGPYIDVEKKGAQPLQYIKKATVEDFKKYYEIDKDLIKKVSYSPNQDHNFEFIEFLTKNNIIGSLAHSTCTFEQTLAAAEHGLSSTTHTLNAMTSFVHDQPGAFGAMLEHDNIKPEFILDSKHVSLVMIKHFLKLKGVDNVIAITDAMRAAGTPLTKTTLGGQNVDIINNGRVAVLENTNTLAGSVALMIHCFENLLSSCGVTLNEAIRLTSTNAAKQLGLKKGKIIENYDADLIILNENNEIEKTILNNQIYTKK